MYILNAAIKASFKSVLKYYWQNGETPRTKLHEAPIFKEANNKKNLCK